MGNLTESITFGDSVHVCFFLAYLKLLGSDAVPTQIFYLGFQLSLLKEERVFQIEVFTLKVLLLPKLSQQK